MARININASSFVVSEKIPSGYSNEYEVKAILRKEEDGTFTVLQTGDSWKPTSKQERDCIASGCFGCNNCE